MPWVWSGIVTKSAAVSSARTSVCAIAASKRSVAPAYDCRFAGFQGFVRVCGGILPGGDDELALVIRVRSRFCVDPPYLVFGEEVDLEELRCPVSAAARMASTMSAVADSGSRSVSDIGSTLESCSPCRWSSPSAEPRARSHPCEGRVLPERETAALAVVRDRPGSNQPLVASG